jgi:hypothetical protein
MILLVADALSVGSYLLTAYEGVHGKVVNYFTLELLDHC